MKKRNLLTLALTALLVCSGCGGAKDSLDDGVLTIGMECAYTPYNWTETTASDDNVKITDGQGYANGYDIIVSRELSKYLGVELEIKAISWDGLIPALESNTIDAIVAGMTDTPKRRNSISFSNEYYHSQMVIITKDKEEYKSYDEINDFAGLKFIAQLGTVQADLIDSLADSESESYAGIVAGEHTKTYPDAFMALEGNACDAVICEAPEAEQFLASHPTGYLDTVLEGNEDFVVSISVGVRKNDTSLQTKINEFLATISEEQRAAWMKEAIESAPGAQA